MNSYPYAIWWPSLFETSKNDFKNHILQKVLIVKFNLIQFMQEVQHAIKFKMSYVKNFLRELRGIYESKIELLL
jgi:hypothetical protein